MAKTLSFAAVLVLIGFVPRAVDAQDHSQSHAPEQGQFGEVHFANSCAPSVAKQFDHAVAILHSFEFGLAINAFNQILATDSTCAMAHWGLALSYWTNPFLASARGASRLASGKAAVDNARRLSVGATERERGYIDAVAQLYTDYDRIPQSVRIVSYERAMGAVAAAQSEDTEARIFYAISLTASAPPEDKTYANRLKAASILEPLFKVQPNHPGLAHYLIHTYDVPQLADRAAFAAKRYSEIAPSAPHALHMPSHTFTRVGLWEKSVESNRRSIEAANRENAPGEVLHASDYATYAYLQMGQDSAARTILRSLPVIAKAFDVNAVTGAAPGAAGLFAFAAIPARIAIELRDWNSAAALQPKHTAMPWTDAMTWFARALGASHIGAMGIARESIDSLASIRDRLAGMGEAYWSQQVAIQVLGAQAWLDFAEHRTEAALQSMQKAAQMEDATDKSAVSPGPLVPARELLADMYLEMGRRSDALTEYERELKKEPNRFRGLYGAMLAARGAGNSAAAARYRAELRKLSLNADVPGRPELHRIRRR